MKRLLPDISYACFDGFHLNMPALHDLNLQQMRCGAVLSSIAAAEGTGGQTGKRRCKGRGKYRTKGEEIVCFVDHIAYV